jgi:hypothetical protein
VSENSTGGPSRGGPPRVPNLAGKNFLLGNSKKAVIDAALGTRSYAEQPQALRNLVSREMWDGLARGEKLHLSAIYNTMQQYGLWEHVTKVNGAKERPEADAHVLGVPGSFSVAGSSGGFSFETGDRHALYEGLVKANFGTDGAAESMLHKGQTSTRESGSGQVTHDLAAPNGLHISIGPGDKFDAHVDKVSPTNPTQGGHTVIDLPRGMLHHRHEVHGDVIRDGFDFVAQRTKIDVLGGLDFDLAGAAGAPTLDQPRVPMPEDRNNPTAPIAVDITLRGPK